MPASPSCKRSETIALIANRQAAIITGYEEKELLEKSFERFIHGDDRDVVVERHFKRLRGDKDLPSTYSFRLICNQGIIKTVQLNSILIDWNNKPATLNFLRDITEQKKIEELFHQAQKISP